MVVPTNQEIVSLIVLCIALVVGVCKLIGRIIYEEEHRYDNDPWKERW